LRAEEAVLLDRLGFDTYSAYVMGIPSVRAGMERADRIDAARGRVARAEAALGAATPPPERDVNGLEHLLPLLGDAHALLGETGPDRPAGDGAPDLGVEVDRVISRLRDLRLPAPGADDPGVIAAMDALRAALGSDRAPGVAVSPPELLEIADAWIAGSVGRSALAEQQRAHLAELEAELGELENAPEPERDVAQWARVEADLDAALDRLAEAEDRVRRHEEAMDRLADLRAEELVLRERERELLSALSGGGTEATTPAWSAVRDSPLDGPPSPESSGEPPPFRGVAGDSVPMSPPPTAPGDVSADDAIHPTAAAESSEGEGDPVWALISRLAEQRAVSFAGSVPLVIDGLPATDEVRQPLLERIAAMSDLVQMVVLSDDPVVLEWATGLGHLAAVIRT
jgi:hypothetical protein